MIDHIVKARSMKEIREIVQAFKRKFDCCDVLKFPVVYFIDNILPDLFPDYKFLKVEEKDLPGQYGNTDHKNKVLKIRTDVYSNALKEDTVALFSIAHEIGHLFLHQEQGYIFSRAMYRFPAYVSAEWQANYFAAELLMSSHLIIDLNEKEIEEKCCVSPKTASIQLNHAKSEKMRGRL